MKERGATLVEVMLVAALILALAAAFGVPGYRSYAASRASADAATTLASDLAFLVRAAQNAGGNQGASLVIESQDPLSYRGYLGRPTSVDPNAKLGAILIERTFEGVSLAGGPISTTTPLLFATNGSAQFVNGGNIAPQHQTIQFVLICCAGGKAAQVDLDLFTGAVTTGL